MLFKKKRREGDVKFNTFTRMLKPSRVWNMLRVRNIDYLEINIFGDNSFIKTTRNAKNIVRINP